jgi:B12-binding domain/radical SAM domain protein
MKIFFHNTTANKYSINALSYIIENMEIEAYFFNSIEELEDKTNKGEKLIFAFSFMSPFAKKEEKISYKIKNLFPQSITIAGGPHLSLKTANDVLQFFDFVFIGDGESAFKKFLNETLSGHIISQRIIMGDNEDINKYQSISEKFKRFGAIEITRGCPYMCFYCQNSFSKGKQPRHKSIENIIKEIEILIRNNFKDIRFITPDISSYGSTDGKQINIEKFREFVYETNKFVKGKGRVFLGSFPSEIRPEHINEDILKILKNNTSSKRIIIGAQSGSDEILKKINRGHSVEDVINAVKILRKYKFEVDVDFIFGFPFETENDLKETKKVIEILTEKYQARIHLHYFMPLPNTPFENLKPKTLTKDLRKFLSSLTARKIAFGQWENQINLGLKSF